MPSDRTMLVCEIKAAMAQHDLTWKRGFKGWKVGVLQQELAEEMAGVALKSTKYVYVIQLDDARGNPQHWCCIWHQPVKRDRSRDRQTWLDGFQRWFKRGRKLLEAQNKAPA